MLMRTLLLASPGVLLTLLWPVLFGPRMWDTPPYGCDLAACSWIVGIDSLKQSNHNTRLKK